jgi:hypothetical protein
LFIHVLGHMLDGESYVDIDLFNREQIDCSLFKTGRIVDLD